MKLASIYLGLFVIAAAISAQTTGMTKTQALEKMKVICDNKYTARVGEETYTVKAANGNDTTVIRRWVGCMQMIGSNANLVWDSPVKMAAVDGTWDKVFEDLKARYPKLTIPE